MTGPDRWRAARRPVGLLARLGLAAVWLVAGATKAGDLAASGRAVHAYQMLPYDVAVAVGAALPFMEIALGVLLLIGLATRLAAAVSTALLVTFIAAISSAWARGLSIDCGCFGGGGELAGGVEPGYGAEIARDTLFLALALFLAIYPLTPFSIDARLAGGDPVPAAEP